VRQSSVNAINKLLHYIYITSNAITHEFGVMTVRSAGTKSLSATSEDHDRQLVLDR